MPTAIDRWVGNGKILAMIGMARYRPTKVQRLKFLYCTTLHKLTNTCAHAQNFGILSMGEGLVSCEATEQGRWPCVFFCCVYRFLQRPLQATLLSLVRLSILGVVCRSKYFSLTRIHSSVVCCRVADCYWRRIRSRSEGRVERQRWYVSYFCVRAPLSVLSATFPQSAIVIQLLLWPFMWLLAYIYAI